MYIKCHKIVPNFILCLQGFQTQVYDGIFTAVLLKYQQYNHCLS